MIYKQFVTNIAASVKLWTEQMATDEMCVLCANIRRGERHKQFPPGPR